MKHCLTKPVLSAALVLGFWSLDSWAAEENSPPPAAANPGSAEKSSPEAIEFFEQRIRPVLVAECDECHNASKHKGGLRLDYRGGWQHGGDSGEVIVPGSAARSLLIKSIRHEDPDLKMPAKSPKLDDAIIADFEHWVNSGAADPREVPPSRTGDKPSWKDLAAVRKLWWCWRPVQDAAPPAVQQAEWSAKPVDRFILARLEAKGLAPAEDCDPRTLLRRLSFLLTGLPPTAPEAAAFVADSARDAQQALREHTERLLSSPRFGEHWARHWMDLFRYAETYGSEGDPEIREAWRYRDYLVRAFNADVPIDRLIREHLAGDLLAEPRLGPDGLNESSIGPAQFRLVEHGFQPVDTLDDQVKAVDNQIDVVTKAFQGLTVSCARCHDHKFDAISQRDYYALYGILASCRPAQVVIDGAAVRDKNRAALQELHGRIKAGLAEAWMGAAQQVQERLEKALAEQAAAVARREQVRALTGELADLDWSARRVIGSGSRPAKGLPAPFAAWNFTEDAKDAMGRLDGHLEGGAELRNGRLVLSGKDAYLRTEPIPVALREKTLEAWVSAANLEQRGGGVLGVESTSEHGFDTLVLGEKEARLWLAGSNNFRRTQAVGGAPEEAKPGSLVHLAVSYAADGTIALYRNGEPYGMSYHAESPLLFEAGKARVLMGLRHKGAGSGFFAGEIAAARLYDRALTAGQIEASYRAGIAATATPDKLAAALTPEQSARRDALGEQIAALREKAAPGEAGSVWSAALEDAVENPGNPLHLWARLGARDGAEFVAGWAKQRAALQSALQTARASNQAGFRRGWDLAGEDYGRWFPSGAGLQPRALPLGEFALEPLGDRILANLQPGGALTNWLSPKHPGLLTSPRFRIDSESISVRAAGEGGAAVRVIVDNYPLPSNPIFPKALLEGDAPHWTRLDTAYRKGSWAYLEFGTRDDLTRLVEGKKDKKVKKDGHDSASAHSEEASWYGVEKVVFHDGKEAPLEENAIFEPFFEGAPPQTPAELAAQYGRVITGAITQWRAGQATGAQYALLDALVRRSLLPTYLGELETLQPLVAEYRRLEGEIARPRHAPGVMESAAFDAPLLPRGDHTKPGETVPRAYLAVLGGPSYGTAKSGRLELADAMASPQNPLSARVAANRIWHWLFGRGLVATVDNFGRLGEKPTHPELLDYLAGKLIAEGWSTKQMLRELVATRTFRLSSTAPSHALEADPRNELLSHFRLQRLEAESIRDSLLAVSGSLDDAMYGPAADAAAPRRSLYLPVRRTSLNPFLQVFDAPKPFTTLGRREATNVPAQSLALLNSPFVIEQADRWAAALLRDGVAAPEERVRRMFAAGLGRPPDSDEEAAAAGYLRQLAVAHHLASEQVVASPLVWRDFAQSLFNLKEFIYLR